MRRVALALVAGLAFAPAVHAAPYGYAEAQGVFENTFDLRLRQILQVWLIAGGYSNVVPTEHFTTRTYKALQKFEADNGYVPNGQLAKEEVDRLIALVDPKFAAWGLRKVTMPGRSAAVWVPFGLDLEAKANASGLHYKDRQGRLSLDFVSIAGRGVEGVYAGMVADKERDGWTIYYKPLKSNEGWFAISAKAPDGTDHYYRYHQDGDTVMVTP